MLYMTECSQGRQPWSDSAPHIAFSAGICSPVSRQNVHERRLPSSRRTHDGYQLSTVEFPRDPFQKGLVSCKMQSGIVFLTVACSVWPQCWAAWLQPKAESPDECSIKDTKDFRCILRWKQTWVCFMILSSQNDFILYIHVHGTCTLLRVFRALVQVTSKSRKIHHPHVKRAEPIQHRTKDRFLLLI